ncbi:MAG: phage tail protein [Janthinobacterium lividum]
MDPILGEIRAVAFPYAPRGWAVCNGALMPINQNAALFSLLGITYGGDGRTTFGLPNLQGRAIVNAGQGPGLSSYPLGTQAGTETVTLNPTQMPAHTHGFGGTFTVSSLDGNVSGPAGNYLAGATGNPQYSETPTLQMAGGSVSGNGAPVGNNQGHPNLQPYLALYYIIALQGVFPQRP